MDSFPSFHYDWDTSSSSMNDPMVDSGKASDISVSSWPMEPIQWAPFPLLHQLSRQRPVSQGPGEGLEGPGRVCRGVQVPQAAPCPPHPGRVTPGKRWEHAWLRAAAPRGAQAKFTLCSTRPVGHSRSARGWSWAPWSGAGQPEATDNRQQQGSALKPTTFYFHVTSSVKEFHTHLDDTINAGVMSVMSVPAGQRPGEPLPTGSCPGLASSGWDCGLQSRQRQRGVRTHSAGIHQVMTYRGSLGRRLAASGGHIMLWTHRLCPTAAAGRAQPR